MVRNASKAEQKLVIFVDSIFYRNDYVLYFLFIFFYVLILKSSFL
jgi:hypothetical protein